MTSLLLVYALTLLLAALLSEWSRRTILSSAVLFLAAGFLTGSGALGFVSVDVDDPVVATVADLALFTILFSDGMKLDMLALRRHWRLPARALGVAMPLTAAVIAVAAHTVFPMPWLQALLLGVVLSPTDPVFAAAIVGRDEIPGKVRHLLNVESGVNDGLSLPFVLALTSLAGGTAFDAGHLILEPLGGLLFGVSVALVVGYGRRLSIFSVARSHEALLPFAVGLLIFAGAQALAVNEYLAAFAAGSVLASTSDVAKREFENVGERLSEVLKLAAVLLIASTVGDMETPGGPILGFAVFVLVVARTLPMLAALVGSGLRMPERLVAAYFGPRGFASLLYGLIVLRSGLVGGERLFLVVTTTVLLSIVLHSSTDVLVAQWFARRSATEP